MPERAGSFKRIYRTLADGTVDAATFVDVPLVEKITLKHGRGQQFKRHIIEFNNKFNRRRITENRRVYHQALDVDGNRVEDDTDDSNQFVDYELIRKFRTKHGRGYSFFRNINEFEHIDRKDSTDRKTHRRRIFGRDDSGSGGRNNSNCWIDVERTDEITLKHGRGQTFRREIYEVIWDDDQFDNTDRTTVPLVEGPSDGYDPPWRLDPLQNIVNVKWRGDQPVPYVILRYRIWRRVDWAPLSSPGDSPPAPLTATVAQYGMFFSANFAWPYDTLPGLGWGIGNRSVDPPAVANEANSATNLTFNGTTITGGPSFGITAHAAGAAYLDYFGSAFYLGSQPTVSPAGRLKASGAPGPYSYGDYPSVADPSAWYDHPPAEWDSGPSFTYEIYEVTPYNEGVPIDNNDGGATIDTVDVDFSGIVATLPKNEGGGDWIYLPIAGAVEPLPRGPFQHNPSRFDPSEASIIAYNHTYYVGLQVLCELSNPPPGYDPDA